MEIQTTKIELVKGISLVGGVTSQKTNTIPILGNILLETTGQNGLKLVGTDLEVGISTTILVQINKEGSITIPAKKLYEIVRELPDGEVEITVAKNNAVNIKAGKAFFKIMGLSKEDYPKLPEWSPKDATEISQALIKESLSLTSFAISYDETRYVLNGVLISVNGSKIRFVATDGRRLAYKEHELENKSGSGRFRQIFPEEEKEACPITGSSGNDGKKNSRTSLESKIP